MIQKGDLDFTMDQQGWWRGYISVLELVHYIRYGLIQSNSRRLYWKVFTGHPAIRREEKAHRRHCRVWER
jgi:hypothetical protein